MTTTRSLIMAAGYAAIIALATPALSAEPTIVVAQATSDLSAGEVTKVDASAKKLTIKHGPLKNLDMPSMTMVFAVAKPEMLSSVKAGDKVRFSADRVDGKITVTRIEKAR